MTTAPTRPHAEVGRIESQQEPGSTDQPADLIAKMRELAAQHGCDGMVILGRNDSVTETMLAPGGGTRVYTLSGYRASCIVYLANAAPSVQASTPAPTPAPAQASTPAPAPAPARASTPACVPGVTQLCYGPAGCRGGQSCTADGRGWTRCDCGSDSPPEAAGR